MTHPQRCVTRPSEQQQHVHFTFLLITTGCMQSWPRRDSLSLWTIRSNGTHGNRNVSSANAERRGKNHHCNRRRKNRNVNRFSVDRALTRGIRAPSGQQMIFLQIFRSLEKVNFELLRQSKGLLIAEPQLNFPFITFVGSTRKMNENIQMKSNLIHLAAEPNLNYQHFGTHSLPSSSHPNV